MGRQLLHEEPTFRAAIERCDAIVRRLGDWSLSDELTADESRSRMDITAISQPCIFALQVALAELWASWGVRPEALVGHSVGEVAAAYLAGVFSLDDAVRIIYHRGRCMELAPERGRMLAAGISPDAAQQLLAGYGDRVALAAVNSPSSVTLSGEAGPLEELAALLEERGAVLPIPEGPVCLPQRPDGPDPRRIARRARGHPAAAGELAPVLHRHGPPDRGAGARPGVLVGQRPPDGPVRRRRGAADRARL